MEAVLEKIGSPQWEPKDYHQFSVVAGNEFENFGTVIASLLPPPNHKDHPELGVGPGDPHAGPYDSELGANVTALGYVEHTLFAQEDGLLPNAIMAVWMMVPSAGAPTGKSPDSASGPVIPNSVFPITASLENYFEDVRLPDYS